jgi:TonB family protein
MKKIKYIMTVIPLVPSAMLLGAALLFAQEKGADSVAVTKAMQPVAADTAQQNLKKDNRNFFERLFGSKPAEAQKDTSAKVVTEEEIARVGQAINHPLRSPRAIHDVVYTYIEGIHHCYVRRLGINPALRGDLMITFTITWEGAVQDVVVIRSTIEDKNLEGCVVGRIRMWKFKGIAQDQGEVTVAYPFRFYP